MKLSVTKKIVIFTIASVAIFGLQNPANGVTPKAGATCSKAGLHSTLNGKKYTCIKSGKKLVWDKGVSVVKASPTPKATPTPSATPTPKPGTSPIDIGSVQPNGKCSKEGDIQPLNGGQMICTNGTWQPYAGAGPTGGGPAGTATGNNSSTLEVTPWGFLSVIGSGNGLGNVSDAALVQAPNGDVRVYFKNGNDSESKLAGFDNFIHSAVSKDNGITWTIESGIRMQVTSPVEVLLKDGGGYQAWGWAHSPGKDYMYYAESQDGLAFTEIPIPGLDVTKCLTSSGASMGPLGDPAIVKLADGTWLLHAQGFGVGNTPPNFARWACVATSTDGKSWTPVQSRSYGGTADVETNPNIYVNKSGKVEWMWPSPLGVITKIGDGTSFADSATYIKAGDPERLDLADGTELYVMGGFDNRAGGALIFAKRIINSYQISTVTGGPATGGSPNRLLTWSVKGASAADISVFNFCLNKKVADISGATVTITSENGGVKVVSSDPANDHACVGLLIGKDKIIG